MPSLHSRIYKVFKTRCTVPEIVNILRKEGNQRDLRRGQLEPSSSMQVMVQLPVCPRVGSHLTLFILQRFQLSLSIDSPYPSLSNFILYVYQTCAWCQKNVLDPLKLQFEKVVSHHVNTRKQKPVPLWSCRCS